MAAWFSFIAGAGLHLLMKERENSTPFLDSVVHTWLLHFDLMFNDMVQWLLFIQGCVYSILRPVEAQMIFIMS